MRKRSQLRRRHAEANSAPTSSSGARVRRATMIAPGLNSYRGPRGPSGVIPTSWPARSVSTRAVAASRPRRLLEPRTVRSPARWKNAESQAPSWLALTRA